MTPLPEWSLNSVTFPFVWKSKSTVSAYEVPLAEHSPGVAVRLLIRQVISGPQSMKSLGVNPLHMAWHEFPNCRIPFAVWTHTGAYSNVQTQSSQLLMTSYNSYRLFTVCTSPAVKTDIG